MTDLLVGADRLGLRLRSASGAFAGPVDVLANGRRIWSVSVEVPDDVDGTVVEWPPALLPHLQGTGRVDLRDPVSGSILAGTQVDFGGGDQPFDVRDASGRPLAVTKWGSLGPSIEGGGPDLGERMLDRTAQLVEDLRAEGETPFIIGGTLLGAVRTGRLLPHDDDTDVAVLAPPDQSPADLVLASLELQRRLEARGYLVVRHSHAHLQITFLQDDGTTDHYIDIFTAFYRDGYFYEPLAMQVEAGAVTIEPLSELDLEGRRFPAPADPEGWLAACYGPGWRTPDPSFVFEVPERTTRRFWNWFGTFNFQRTYWTAAHAGREEHGADVESLALCFPEGGRVVDVGAGRGRVARGLAATGRSVLACDFTFPALAALRSLPGVEARWVNLNDRMSVLDLALRVRQEPEPCSFYLGHVYETLSGDAKENVLLLLSRSLRPGAVAIVDIYTELAADYSFDDPGTWHCEPEALAASSRA
ncbi:MAG TPA: hypothetical protein VIL55_09510, partial [Naasia sp.]